MRIDDFSRHEDTDREESRNERWPSLQDILDMILEEDNASGDLDSAGETSDPLAPGREKLPENSCCICTDAVDPDSLVVEMRPTGENEMLESWPYCLPCWEDMLKLREKALHYEAFFQATPVEEEHSTRGPSF